jgi:hypothetical protein
MRSWVLAAAIACVLLGACAPAKPVGCFRAHDAERRSMINACLADDGLGQNCRNAKQAEFELRGIPARNGEAVTGSD